MASFDFDKARAERRAKVDPPAMTVGGETFVLPVGLPAAVNLELMARDSSKMLTTAETVDMLKLLYPAETVDGWLADGWTDIDLDKLFAATLYLVRGIPLDEDGNPDLPDPDDGDGESGEARAPDNGRASSSPGGQRSKPTSKPTTGSTSRTRTRTRS